VGRTYLPGEDQPGRNNVLVLGYEVWRQQFHGDRNVIGKTANLDGSPYVVIGVMPAGFRFPFGKPNLVYIPMHVRPPWRHSYRDHWVETVGRLKHGVTLQAAQAEMTHVILEIGQQNPETDKGRTAQLAPIAAASHEEHELPEIAVMFAAVLAVLLIACANVTGCSWRAALRASARWRCASPSARSGTDWCDNCWWRMRCSVHWARQRDCCWLQRCSLR
jgi:putative ABC transport system permease protein